MRGHLAPPHYGGMDPARYMIRINGHLGVTLLSAFPALTSWQHGSHTVLTGLLDQSALFGVLAEVEALGLELIEVRQLECELALPPGFGPRTRNGDHTSCAAHDELAADGP
jgi:hypothetical protein